MSIQSEWEHALQHYAKLLRATNWRIRAIVGPIEDGMLAQTQRCGGSHDTDICFNTEPNAHFKAGMDANAAHEILHLVFDEVERIARARRLLLGDEVAYERAIQDIAAALAEVSPSRRGK